MSLRALLLIAFSLGEKVVGKEKARPSPGPAFKWFLHCQLTQAVKVFPY